MSVEIFTTKQIAEEARKDSSVVRRVAIKLEIGTKLTPRQRVYTLAEKQLILAELSKSNPSHFQKENDAWKQRTKKS